MKNVIKELRKQRGWTQEELRKKLNWSQPDVSRAENGVTGLDQDKIKKLADVFGVSMGVILGEKEDILFIGNDAMQQRNIKILSESSLQPKVADDIENISFGPDMIPILGNANGSTEALVLNFDQPIGQILRHPNQKGMKGAFALYARGESMSPRYMPGEPVYVIANKPPQKGQDCIVEMKNGESYLKIYTKQTEAELICRQLSPDKSWKRLLIDIKSIHAVVGRG